MRRALRCTERYGRHKTSAKIGRMEIAREVMIHRARATGSGRVIGLWVNGTAWKLI